MSTAHNARHVGFGVNDKNSWQTVLNLKAAPAAVVPPGFLIGSATDIQAATGCTVILAKQGAVASVAVLGGAPATRETDLLAPTNMVERIHAVVLSGGSAFGLDAASGVAEFLADQGIGLVFGGENIPIVVGASLFDLGVGDARVRPDAKMGRAAAVVAQAEGTACGNVGAGCGASVGKFLGPAQAMKGGLGMASVEVPLVGESLIVTAVVAVNALGAVYDRESGRYVAGALLPPVSKAHIADPLVVLTRLTQTPSQSTSAADSIGNTTIGAILTNGALSKPQAARTALMAHDGLARSIYPVHTANDGDALFCLSLGDVATSPDLVGALAATVVEQAVLNAVYRANSAFGLMAASDLLACDD
ncbi:MAG: P1 family peptidase [Coriobacteriales bacterium]|jgi:L-aminopeptidase/D-esterase-like protein|nr:P1 family peptidase [Coriobacteriales bacterium]